MLAALPPKPWSWNLEIHPACNRGHVSAWRHRGSGREWRFGHTLRGSWCHLQCTHKVQLTSSAITQRRHLHNVPVTSLRCTKSQWCHSDVQSLSGVTCNAQVPSNVIYNDKVAMASTAMRKVPVTSPAVYNVFVTSPAITQWSYLQNNGIGPSDVTCNEPVQFQWRHLWQIGKVRVMSPAINGNVSLTLTAKQGTDSVLKTSRAMNVYTPNKITCNEEANYLVIGF